MKGKLTLSVLILSGMLALSACGPILSESARMLSNLAQAAQATPTTAAPAAATPAPIEAAPVSNVRGADAAAVDALQTVYEQVYQAVNPSVVNISVTVGGPNITGFPGQGFPQGAQEAQGSGFVWDQQGHIVTNNHVVEGADSIQVTFADGSTVDAQLVGADVESDLAVIQVNLPADQLSPVQLADSSLVEVGQVAIAIGNPYGLAGTMTSGIVSALSRSLPVEDNSRFATATYTIPDVIQTDAAINPGNSGGVLVNTDGQVMGVTAAIRSTSGANSGIGFVIPANIVAKVVPQLIDSGSYEHPRLGISGVTVSAGLAEAMNLDASQRGVLVVEVTSGGPAEKAGLQGSTVSPSGNQQIAEYGDVITAVDGQPVTKFEDLTSYIFQNTQVGQTVALTILRKGQEMTVDVTLSAVQPR